MNAATVFVGFCLCWMFFVSSAPADNKNKKCGKKDLYAVCNLTANTNLTANPNRDSKINGELYFWQPVVDNCRYGWVNIQVNINNIPKYNFTKEHGVHIHQYGDLTNGCESMGGHYNPEGTTHGSPWHPANARHVGDLGNFRRVDRRARQYGKIRNRHADYMVELYGKHSVIGRGIVLHADRDDLGKRHDPESLKTGNAGARLACCVIGRSDVISTSKFSLYR